MSKPKGEDIQRQTKLIQFKENSPYELNAYYMIDKVRYYQSKFIIKLVNDFFEQHHLTVDSPYEVIRAVVGSYIDGKQLPNEPAGDVSNDLMAKLVLQQQAMMQQLMAQQMLLGPSLSPVMQQASPVADIRATDKIPSQQPVNSNSDNLVQEKPVVSAPLSNSNSTPDYEVPIQNQDVGSIDMEDGDMEDDFLSGLTTGFSSIL